ncbi:MAG: cobalt ECF transporter T component CbiQ [Desulfuromonas sp.]|nr:MAG: cobalt ECF transporter T component CbiQ [Desulfuromonas sp.]
MQIDRFAYLNRWRRRHPAEKAGIAILCLLACLLSRSVMVPLLAAFFMGLLTVVGARIPWRTYWRLLLVPLGFLLFGSLAILIDLPANGFDIREIRLATGNVPVAALLVSRSFGAVCSLLFLALTTPMTDILTLLRRCGFPALLLELMLLAYRQIFLLLDTAARIRQAQEARLGYLSWFGGLRSFGLLGAALLRQTFQQSRQLHLALQSRGYRDDIRVLSPEFTFSLWALAAGGGAGLSLIVLALIAPAWP